LNRGEQAFECSKHDLTSAGWSNLFNDVKDFTANVFERLASIALFALQEGASCARLPLRLSGSAHIGESYRAVVQRPT
jgi:hypothetical protein